MSFRLFVYYCTLGGGWAALVGWGLGRALAPNEGLGEAGVKGLLLGMMVALAVGLVDALATTSLRQKEVVVFRILTALVVGCVAGLLGGLVGQAFLENTSDRGVRSALRVGGWAMTGLLIGSAPGVFDILSRLRRREELQGARRKLINGLLGGALGGLLGGVGSVLLHSLWVEVFATKDTNALWSPTALGFLVLGLLIGLLIGLAQVILKDAWLRVESGTHPVREVILSHPVVTIGRSEGCDLGLFGGSGVEKVHARLERRDARYYLSDTSTSAGTFLNGERVTRTVPLGSGDVIAVGDYTLRFGERRKKTP